MGKSDKDKAAQVHRDVVKADRKNYEPSAAHDKGVADRLAKLIREEAEKN